MENLYFEIARGTGYLVKDGKVTSCDERDNLENRVGIYVYGKAEELNTNEWGSTFPKRDLIAYISGFFTKGARETDLFSVDHIEMDKSNEGVKVMLSNLSSILESVVHKTFNTSKHIEMAVAFAEDDYEFAKEVKEWGTKVMYSDDQNVVYLNLYYDLTV